jgi:hypothetical protein
VPFVNPVTTHVNGPDTQVQVLEPWFDVTVYEVIGAPPLLAGAVHETVACALPRTAVTDVGAPGTFDDATESETRAEELPFALTATTENTYAVPLVVGEK